jgi:hypothetical protein
VFAQQIVRDFGRRTLKERWRKHTVHGLKSPDQIEIVFANFPRTAVPPAGQERAVSDPSVAMIDFATNRLVLPCD